nr:hypothetical protein [Tanacetum cinerariifolium]
MMNQNYFEPNYSCFEQPQQYFIDHQEDLNQQQMNDVHNTFEDKMKESYNELLNMMKLFYENILWQREEAANVSINIIEPSRRLKYFFYDNDDYDYEESNILLNEFFFQIPWSNAMIEDPEDSLIIGDEELSTIPEKESDEVIKSSVEDLVPIPSKSKDSSGSDSEYVLPSCDDFSPTNISEGKYETFSNLLFDSNHDFTSSDDESLSNEDVLEDNVKIYSNPLLKFNDEYISSDVNPLFDEVLEDIERKVSYDSILDEPTLLVTPFSDSNKDEYSAPSDDIELLLHHDQSTPKISVVSILDGDFYDAPIDDLMTEDKIFDPGIHEKICSPTYVSLPFEDRHYLFFTNVVRILLLYFIYSVVSPFLLSSGSEDTIFDPDISDFHF